MKKRYLAIGLVFLFLFSSVVPISIGYNGNNDTDHVNNFDILPGVRWMKKLGSSYENWFISVHETSDSGYILLGGLMPSGSSCDAWLVKTDSDGNVEWQHSYGKPGAENWDNPSSVLQTPDGGYIFCGQTESYTETTIPEIWLIKTDTTGNEVWNKRYGPGTCASLHMTRDGGYILSGSMFDPIDTFRFNPICLLKTDRDGNEIWRRAYWGDPNHQGRGMCVDETSDGGFIVAGFLWHNHEGHIGVLLKADSSGIEQWNTTFETRGSYFESVHQTPDGGFIVGGTGRLIKTDKDGNEIWNKTYATPTLMYSVHAIDLTIDGGFILTGESSGYTGTGINSCILKTDALGNKEWQIDIDASESEWKELNCIQQTSDGGYIAAGSEYGLLLKVELFENTPPSPPIIKGPTRGITKVPSIYTADSNDPDGDNISYLFNWDVPYRIPPENNYTGWTAPFAQSTTRAHTYQVNGTYHIRVKAMDEHYVQSDWATLTVTMPYSFNKPIFPFLTWLFLRFPNAFPLLQQRMGY